MLLKKVLQLFCFISTKIWIKLNVSSISAILIPLLWEYIIVKLRVLEVKISLGWLLRLLIPKDSKDMFTYSKIHTFTFD